MQWKWSPLINLTPKPTRHYDVSQSGNTVENARDFAHRSGNSPYFPAEKLG